MTPDDTPIPEDDAIAREARRALDRLAERTAPEHLSWNDVQLGARRVRRRRVAAVSATCAILVLGVGTAAAVGRSRGGSSPRVAGGGSTTTTSTSPASTTTTAPATVPTGPAGTAPGVHTTVPPSLPNLDFLRGDAPRAGDVSGTITITSGSVTADQHTAEVGRPVDVTANILNVTSHRIVPSCVCKPTSYATICTGPTPGSQSLWWMTNSPMDPGGTDGRGGVFTPTDKYLGSVTCELDVVTTDGKGTVFDTSAGGDAGTATFVARATAVAPVTVQVVPAKWVVTTSGAVGPLQFGVSTAADVQTAAGTADSTATGSFLAPGRRDYQALGYDCSDQNPTGRLPLHVQPQEAGPYCRTIFYVNTTTQKLGAFATTSDQYETDHGTTVGMSHTEAEQRESATAVYGCFGGIQLGDLNGTDSEVYIWVASHPTDPVVQLAAEGATDQVGLMFC